MLKNIKYKTKTNEILPKRQVYVLSQSEQQREREAVSQNVGSDIEAVGIDRSELIRGKVASILTEIRAVQEKVSTLGTSIADQFRQYLHTKTQISIDTSNIQSSQEQFNQWLRNSDSIRQLSESNNQGYQRLDTALDQVMLKVQMRKELAVRLDNLATGAEKTAIGSLFESRMDSQEGTIEAPNLEIENFRYRLEIVHEFTKYAKLVKMTRENNATSIETARVLPEGTAYPRNDGNVAFMRYWVEMKTDQQNLNPLPVVYAIDNVYGRIQKFDPRAAFDPAHRMAWVYADVATNGPSANDAARQQRQLHGSFYEDRWANWHTTRSAERQSRMPTTIEPQVLAQLVQNQRYERAFISGERRSFTAGTTPDSMATSEVAIATGQFERFTTEFNRLRDAHHQLYTTTQPGHQPYGHHLREMYSTVTRPEFRTNIPTYTPPAPTTGPSTGPSTGPTTGPSTVPRETTEVARRNNDLLIHPRNGRLNWGNERLAYGFYRLALLQRPVEVRNRTIRTILVNGRPRDDLRANNTVILGGNGTEIIFVQPLTTAQELPGNFTIVIEDENADGVKTLRTITLERGERQPLNNETAREATNIDSSLITGGTISVESLPGLTPARANRRLAELPNIRSSMTRTITGVQINGQNKPASDITVSGNSIVLMEAGSISRLSPGDNIRLTFSVADSLDRSQAAITRVENIAIPTSRPELQISPFEITLPQDRKLHFGQLDNHSFNRSITIAELSATPQGHTRVVMNDQGQVHPFLTVDGNRVVVRQGNPVNIPLGEIRFRIATTNGHAFATQEWVLINETATEANIGSLEAAVEGRTTLRQGEITSTTNGRDIISLPAAQVGIHRNVSAVTTDPPAPAVDYTADNFGFKASSGGTEMLSFIDSPGSVSRTIPQGRTLVLTIQSINEAGNVIKTEEIRLTTGAAEAPRRDAVRLESTENIDGTPLSRIQLGHQLTPATSDRPLGALGVRLTTDLPPGASLRVAEVYQSARGGNTEVIQGGVRNGEPIIGYENGRLVLRANTRLPLGRHFVKLESNQGGARQEHWIAIENQPSAPPTENDVAFLPGTPENIQGPLDARTSPNGLQIAQLVPRREGTMRWLHMMTINGVLYNSLSPTFPAMYRGDQGFMMHFNEETGTLTLPAGANISPSGSPARIELNFMVIVPGAGAQMIRRVINVLPGTQPSPTARPIESSQRVPSDTEQSQLRENLAMRDLLYETWYTNSSWNLMKSRLTNFQQSGALDRFTLATIDANSGRFAVNNDGYSTLLDIRGHQIVIHGGPVGNEAEMRFANTPEGARDAMVYAAAANRIMNDCINRLGLNALNKFDSAHRDGTFFEMDGNIIQVESGGPLGGLTEDNVWSATTRADIRNSGAFIGLINKIMADHVGTNNGISARTSGNEATLEHSVDVSTTRAVQGEALSLTLRNLDSSMIYSYSGNRMDWHQVPRDVTGTYNLSISPGEINRENTQIVRKGANGIEERFMILTLCATPRDASDARRPRVISLEIPIVNAYRPERTGERSFAARPNVSTKSEITYNLDGGIISRQAGRRYTSGENLTIREQPNTDGRLVVLKNGNEFAYIGLENNGIPQPTFINAEDANRYGILAPATTGATRNLQFKEL